MSTRVSRLASLTLSTSVVLFAASCCATVAAAEDRVIENGFATLTEMTEKVANAKRDFDAFDACVRARSSDPAIPTDAIRLIARPEGRRPVTFPVDERGCLTMPAELAGAARKTPVTINVPAGKATLSIVFSIRQPTVRELDYAQLMAGAIQLNAAIRREAGVMRFMAPKVKGLLLLWYAPEPAAPGLRVLTSAGEQRLTSIPAVEYVRPNVDLVDMPSGARALEILLDDKMVKANPAIVLDLLPDAMMPLP